MGGQLAKRAAQRRARKRLAPLRATAQLRARRTVSMAPDLRFLGVKKS